MRYTGRIHSTNLVNENYFSILEHGRLVYFYLQNNLMKKFKKYLYPGRFVSFEYDENSYKIIQQKKCYQTKYFIYIVRKDFSKREVFYDIDVIRKGIKDLFLRQENIMFLDLEMSMVDYSMPKDFQPELLQVGLVVLNKEQNVIYTKTFHVKPTFFPLSKRTKKFLSLWDVDISSWMDYPDFYKEFVDILEQYHPVIMAWGKNDSLYLKQSVEMNQLPNIEDKCNFINLLQVVKNYFHLKNDLGLFKAYTYFTNESLDKQAHDALEDAWVTYKVYQAFYKMVMENKLMEIEG